MAPARPFWKGYLKLSLVSCPIALFPASSSAERVSFRQISKKTGHRLKQQLVDSVTGDVVESGDKGRGYQIGKDEYLPVEDDELDSPGAACTRDYARLREITRDYARLREITRDYKPLTSATKTTAMIPGLVNGRPSKIGEQRWDLECFHHRTRYGRADVCGPTLLSPHGSSRHASSRHALITRYDCFPTVMSQRMPLRRHISVSRNGLSYLLTIRLS